MLNDLTWIAPEKSWPPDDLDEKARLAEHAANRDIYNNLHEKVFPKYAEYLKDKAEADKKVAIILGWGEKATTNYINLCIGEPPDVEVDGADIVEERPDEEVLIDVSRYGIGLYEPTEDGIFAQNPENCYIVTAPGNIRKVTEYVFFSEFEQDKQKYVKFTIHGKGYIQHLVYSIKENKLDAKEPLANFTAYKGLKVDKDGKQSTGVDEVLIVRVDNALSSERRYGRSDYTPSVRSLLEALEIAFARRDEVLGIFARPGVMLPESAFNHFNQKLQKWEVQMDEPFMVEPGGEVKYLTWDANLTSVENAIKDKMDQLLQMLDLVKQEDLNKAESGTALAFRLIPTTSRVRKFASGLRKAIPKVLSLHSKLKGAISRANNEAGQAAKSITEFEPGAVSVAFKDGIPRDPMQTAQWATMVFIAGGMSLQTYISITQGLEMSDDPESAIQKEIVRIKADKPPAPPAPDINLQDSQGLHTGAIPGG